jgi:hypothetical protein
MEPVRVPSIAVKSANRCMRNLKIDNIPLLCARHEYITCPCDGPTMPVAALPPSMLLNVHPNAPLVPTFSDPLLPVTNASCRSRYVVYASANNSVCSNRSTSHAPRGCMKSVNVAIVGCLWIGVITVSVNHLPLVRSLFFDLHWDGTCRNILLHFNCSLFLIKA